MRSTIALAATGVFSAALVASCSFDAFCLDGSSDCVDAGCADGLRNGDETDVDCGGSCGPCGTGLACSEDVDCEAGRCAQEACCDVPCTMWSRSWGSLVDDRATAIAVSSDGSIYVAGRFSGAVEFGLGPLISRGVDIFVLRLGPDGALRWGKSFGGVLDDAEVELAVTASGSIVLAVGGASQSVDFGGGPLESPGNVNLYLAELDATGAHVWSRALQTDTEAHPAGLAIAPDGDLLVSGSMYDVDAGGGVLASLGGLDPFLVRLSPTGEHRWSKRFGSVWHDLGGRVATDAEGNAYITANYSRAWSFGGDLLPWANGTGCLAVAKLDPHGEHVWSHGYADGVGTVGQIARDIVVDELGTTWVTGSFGDATDFGAGVLEPGVGSIAMLLAYAPDGSLRLVRALGEHTSTGLGLTPDGAGGVALVGSFRGDVDFGGGVRLERGIDHVFVSRFDRDGNAAWARSGGGQLTSDPARVAREATTGSFILAGGFRGELDIAFGGVKSAGESDTFVLAVEP